MFSFSAKVACNEPLSRLLSVVPYNVSRLIGLTTRLDRLRIGLGGGVLHDDTPSGAEDLILSGAEVAAPSGGDIVAPSGADNRTPSGEEVIGVEVSSKVTELVDV